LNLRRRIFDVLEDLATAFRHCPGNKITEARFPALYDNSLIFLYRLLFVLYAESRGLLPVRPHDWTKASVDWLSSSPAARWQGHRMFFTSGVTWTAVANHVAMKARYQEPCVFDADSMRLTPKANVIVKTAIEQPQKKSKSAKM
jgi:hypothetical protein